MRGGGGGGRGLSWTYIRKSPPLKGKRDLNNNSNERHVIWEGDTGELAEYENRGY